MKSCIVCGSNKVESTEVEIALNSSSVKSIKVVGEKCSACGEVYYGMRTAKQIEKIKQMTNDNLVGA